MARERAGAVETGPASRLARDGSGEREAKMLLGVAENKADTANACEHQSPGGRLGSRAERGLGRWAGATPFVKAIDDG